MTKTKLAKVETTEQRRERLKAAMAKNPKSMRFFDFVELYAMGEFDPPKLRLTR